MFIFHPFDSKPLKCLQTHQQVSQTPDIDICNTIQPKYA